MIKPIKFLYISLIIFVIDKITKIAIRQYLPQGGITIIGDLNETLHGALFRLIHVENPAAAFSLGFSSGLLGLEQDAFNRLFFSIAASLVLIFILFLLKNAKHKIEAIALSLIIGGAVGNLTDRIITGSVTDFIDVIWFRGMFGGRWPTFNVADSSVVIGAILFMIYGFIIEPRINKQIKANNQETLQEDR
jgi:signal peptidase II